MFSKEFLSPFPPKNIVYDQIGNILLMDAFGIHIQSNKLFNCHLEIKCLPLEISLKCIDRKESPLLKMEFQILSFENLNFPPFETNAQREFNFEIFLGAIMLMNQIFHLAEIAAIKVFANRFECHFLNYVEITCSFLFSVGNTQYTP